jgi:hypothetical protein
MAAIDPMSDNHNIRFTIDGKVFEKTRIDFLQIPIQVPIKTRKYSALLGCRRLPPQDAIAAVTGVPAERVGSQTAARILQRLGFEVELAE